jgi:hypothetical protein
VECSEKTAELLNMDPISTHAVTHSRIDILRFPLKSGKSLNLVVVSQNVADLYWQRLASLSPSGLPDFSWFNIPKREKCTK